MKKYLQLLYFLDELTPLSLYNDLLSLMSLNSNLYGISIATPGLFWLDLLRIPFSSLSI